MRIATRTDRNREARQRETSKSAKAWHWLLALFARLLFWRDLPELQESGLKAPREGEIKHTWDVVAWTPEGDKRRILGALRASSEQDFELNVLDLVTKHPGCRLTIMTPDGGGRLTGRQRRAVVACARRQMMPRGLGRIARRVARGGLLRSESAVALSRHAAAKRANVVMVQG